MYVWCEIIVFSSNLCSKTLRVWELNPATRKVLPTDCNLGQLKRIINCVKISHDDQFMYCGTTSGDILQVTSMQSVS